MPSSYDKTSRAATKPVVLDVLIPMFAGVGVSTINGLVLLHLISRGTKMGP